MASTLTIYKARENVDVSNLPWEGHSNLTVLEEIPYNLDAQDFVATLDMPEGYAKLNRDELKLAEALFKKTLNSDETYVVELCW